MQLLTRIGIAALTATLAATVAVPAAPASAADKGKPSKARVIATAVLPGPDWDSWSGPGTLDAEVAPSGRFLLVSGQRGLTKYRISPKRIIQLGTAPALRHSRVVLHPRAGYAYVPTESKGRVLLNVVDTSTFTPSVVRQLEVPATRTIWDLAVSPAGDRLYLSVDGGVRTVDLDRPRSPVLGALVSGAAGYLAVPFDTSAIAVGTAASDGAEIRTTISNHRADDALSTIGSGSFAVPGRADYTQFVSRMMFSPSNDDLYVEVSGQPGWCEGLCGNQTSISRFDMADMAARTHAVEDHRASMRAFSPNGRRLYAVASQDTDEHAGTGHLRWYDDRLTEKHAVPLAGDVKEVAVSRAGATKGLVYVVAWQRGRMRVSSLHVS